MFHIEAGFDHVPSRHRSESWCPGSQLSTDGPNALRLCIEPDPAERVLIASLARLVLQLGSGLFSV